MSTVVATKEYSGYESLQKGSDNKRLYFLLYLLTFLFLIYGILDIQTNANTVVKTGVRGAVHVTLFIILLFLGSYYALTFGRETLFSPVKTVLWLIFGWIFLSNLFQYIFITVDTWSVLTQLGLSLLWLLIYHFFSYYVQRCPKAFPQIQICIMIMFGFYVFSYIYGMHSLRTHLIHVGQDRLPVVNLAYSVVVFSPWLLLVRRKGLRLCGMGIVLLSVLVSMKRGAIIVFPLMLSASMLVEALISKRNVLRTFLKIICVMILFFMALFVADIASNGYLSDRFSSKELSDGSGRANAFRVALQEISHRPPWYFLIGRGSDGSMKHFGGGLHNEWLEFLYNFGLIGGVFYALLILALSMQVSRLIVSSSPFAPAYVMVVVYVLVVGMFGIIYFAHTTLYVMAFVGAVEGLTLKNKMANIWS